MVDFGVTAGFVINPDGSSNLSLPTRATIGAPQNLGETAQAQIFLDSLSFTESGAALFNGAVVVGVPGAYQVTGLIDILPAIGSGSVSVQAQLFLDGALYSGGEWWHDDSRQLVVCTDIMLLDAGHEVSLVCSSASTVALTAENAILLMTKLT